MNIIRKIQALLAKADRTDNEYERETYYEKAQELIVKHAVSEADLAPEDREKVITTKFPMSAKTADATLLNAVASVHGVGFFVSGSTQRGGRHGTLVGFPSDITFVEALFASLLLHRESELVKASRNNFFEHGKTFSHGFRHSYANRIRLRLQELHDKATKAAGGELVFVGRKNAVDAALAQFNLRDTAVKVRRGAGTGMGHDAANRANIHGSRQNISSNTRQLGR